MICCLIQIERLDVLMKTSVLSKMSASSSYAPCHSHVNPMYFETSNDLQMQQGCSTFSETSSIQCTPSSALVKVELQDSELWRRFYQLTTEMIVNKQGRWVTEVLVYNVCCLLVILLRVRYLVVLVAEICKMKTLVNLLASLYFPQIYAFDVLVLCITL